MSLELSGEITAIATAALAAFAIVTAIFAVLAFNKQSKEVKHQAAMLDVQSGQLTEQRKINEKQTDVLALQASDLRSSIQQREHDAHEHHRAQASRVWIVRAEENYGPLGIALKAEVRNTSEQQQPIYNAKLHWYEGSQPYGDPEPLGTIHGHEKPARAQTFPVGTDMTTCGAYLTFHDAAGYAWMRAPDGALAEQQPDELDNAAKDAIRRLRSHHDPQESH